LCREDNNYLARIVLEENGKDVATAVGTGDDERLVAEEYGNPNVANTNIHHHGQLYEIYEDGKIRIYHSPPGQGFTAPGGKSDIYVTPEPEDQGYNWKIQPLLQDKDKGTEKYDYVVYIYTRGFRYWTFTADNGALVLVERNDWLNPVQILRIIPVDTK